MQNDPFIFCKKAKSQVDFSLKKKQIQWVKHNAKALQKCSGR